MKIAVGLLFVVWIFALVCTPLAEAASYRVNRLGSPTTAFYLPALRSDQDLRKMVKIRKAEIERLLAKRGWKGSIEDLVRAVESGKIEETEIAPGSNYQFWGGFRFRP